MEALQFQQVSLDYIVAGLESFSCFPGVKLESEPRAASKSPDTMIDRTSRSGP